jgi:hypothetical protein
MLFLEVLWIELALATFCLEESENPNELLTPKSLGVVAIVSCLTTYAGCGTGGMPFSPSQMGFACDNILEEEVVLGNVTI